MGRPTRRRPEHSLRAGHQRHRLQAPGEQLIHTGLLQRRSFSISHLLV
jgi:hypothetical protein